jgi:branched-chain amino acid transport system permease protein
MMDRRALRLVPVLLVVAGLLVLPQVGSRFHLYLTLQILLLSLFALGFNLLFGYSGLLSFGHAAFYAAGAYGAGLLLKHVAPALLLGVVGGALVAVLLAALIGFFCVRHTEIYFAMLTLAFGMMVYSVIWKWRAVTGGDDGLGGIPRAPLGIPGLVELNMRPMAHYYYFVLAVTLLAVVVLHRLVHSPFGLVLQGLRENAERVEFAGIPVKRYRLIAFAISGFFAGLAGAMLGPLENIIAPDAAHWTKSAEPVLATLLGGPYSFWGPIVGAALFLGLKEVVVRYTEYWLLVLGLILLGLLLGLRGGVMGVFAPGGLVWNFWKRRA